LVERNNKNDEKIIFVEPHVKPIGSDGKALVEKESCLGCSRKTA
jgi:hypothetical protein